MVERRDLPLFRWGEELRIAKAKRRRLTRRAVYVGLLVGALLGTAAVPPAPLLLWNASPSAPVGLYFVRGGEYLRPGHMVVAWPPPSARRMAAERRYLPMNVPLVKRIAAAREDRICGVGSDVLVNGRLVARRLAADRLGRPLPAWQGCRTLEDGQFLLLMQERPDSFDGRYFGPSTDRDIVARAWLLWARPSVKAHD